MIGQAGTLESNDILVTVMPNENEGEIELELDSIVMVQYGAQIRGTIVATLREIGIGSLKIKAVDRGALDSTIRARVLTALDRAGINGGEQDEEL